ncbi:MAG: SDR family oxidoreductase [Candidatus Nanopelagicaceae bacterium]|nr:SDR family oxidoreductase [Candidatus Nanopelagicaceae bacterium]
MTRNRFIGKTVVISGGAGGLGAAIAHEFGQEGAHVAVIDNNQAAISDVLKSLRAKHVTADGRAVDVRDGKAVTQAIGELANSLGDFDILVAAAGGSLGTPRVMDDISDEDLDLVIDVNVKGTYYCARAVVPYMKKKGGGAIVTFSSIGGRSVSPVTGVPYAAAKAAILGLTRRLAKEVGLENIRVNAIAPGLFLTDRLAGMFENLSLTERNDVLAGIPLGRMPEIRECVDPVLFLASNESSYITGAVLDVNGGRFMTL